MIDFELYNGAARPPLAGQVGFYLGGHPDFKPPPDSTIVRGHVGRYRVDWYCSVAENGLIRRDALVRLDDYWRVDLSLSAKRQEDVDRLIASIAQLPLFAQRAKSAFGPHGAAHPW